MGSEFFQLITGCGSMDYEFLANLMKDNDILPDDVIDEIESSCGSKEDSPEVYLDFNSYVHSAFSIIEADIKEKLAAIADVKGIDIEGEIFSYSPDIYTNYLDSFFDDKWFNEFMNCGVSEESALRFFREELGYDDKDKQDECD